MSIRGDSFYNPFKNWPFSPGRSGNHPACSCPIDIDGNPMSLVGQQCAAGYIHGYTAMDPPPRQIPAVRITRPDDENSKPAEKKTTAIDSLRAVSSLRIKRQPVKQTLDHGNDQASNNENSGMQTRKTPNAVTGGKENDNTNQNWSRPPVARANTTTNDPARGVMESTTNRTRATIDSAANRSVSMSTVNSSDTRGTLSSWKNNSQASGSQTTLCSIDSPEVKEPKGKEKAVYNSPESLHNYSGASYGSGITHQTTAVAAKDTNSQVHGELSNPDHVYGKMVLGCSQCLFDPKLRVVPCGCLICIDCGGRFWNTISNRNEVICGCGDRVVSMINVDPMSIQSHPNLPSHPIQETPQYGLYSPSTMYSPASYVASPGSSTGAVQFSSPTPPSRSHFSPLKMENTVATAAPLLAIPELVIEGIPRIPMSSANMSRILMMDAETAIQNAPFINLGRNSLAQNWSCVKIGNIPYNVTSEELMEFLGKNSNIVPEVAGSIGIHVIMDRSTGKTMDAYVEFVNAKDAWKCVSRRRSRVLGNRHLSLDVVDPSELMKDVFPRAKGIVWEGVIPHVSANKSEFGAKTEVISREELVLIVNHARTPHRSPFSRKCLQRPFQSLMSIVSKFPWFAVDIYTIQQRDYIFQALLSAIDILKRQIKRGRTMPNLDIDLLKALLRVGIRCSGFTDTQKYELVKTAEFGAEGIQVDSDIGILSGFEALGKAVGAERRVLEFYALLLELSVSPFLAEPSSQGLAAAELIRSKNITKQNLEESKKSHLTMAEASAVEWSTIEKAVHTVLPTKLPYVKDLSKNNASRERHAKK